MIPKQRKVLVRSQLSPELRELVNECPYHKSIALIMVCRKCQVTLNNHRMAMELLDKKLRDQLVAAGRDPKKVRLYGIELFPDKVRFVVEEIR